MLILVAHLSGYSKPFSARISSAATTKPSSGKLRTRASSLVNATSSLGGSQLFRIKQLLWKVSPVSLNKRLYFSYAGR